MVDVFQIVFEFTRCIVLKIDWYMILKIYPTSLSSLSLSFGKGMGNTQLVG